MSLSNVAYGTLRLVCSTAFVGTGGAVLISTMNHTLNSKREKAHELQLNIYAIAITSIYIGTSLAKLAAEHWIPNFKLSIFIKPTAEVIAEMLAAVTTWYVVDTINDIINK